MLAMVGKTRAIQQLSESLPTSHFDIVAGDAADFTGDALPFEDRANATTDSSSLLSVFCYHLKMKLGTLVLST